MIGSGLGYFFGKTGPEIRLGYTEIVTERLVKDRTVLSEFVLLRKNYHTDLETLKKIKGAEKFSFYHQENELADYLQGSGWTKTPLGNIRLEKSNIVEFCFRGTTFENNCDDTKILGKY